MTLQTQDLWLETRSVLRGLQDGRGVMIEKHSGFVSVWFPDRQDALFLELGPRYAENVTHGGH